MGKKEEVFRHMVDARSPYAEMAENEVRWGDHFAALNNPLATPLREVQRIADTWTLPELTTREHFLAHIGLMSVLNRPDEFRAHLWGALNAGIPPADIVAVLVHTKHYAGQPAAVDAMILLHEVITRREDED